MTDAARPFRRDLDWRAEWTGERWFVLGLFESEWGVKFVQDATIENAVVYAYIDYGQRPPADWVKKHAIDWNLETLYTRLTMAEAIARVRTADSVRSSLCESRSSCSTVSRLIDSFGELIEDRARSQQWRFAFYVRRADGTHSIVVVGGLSTVGVEEGDYNSGYGFGNAARAHTEIPLNFVDWARQVAVVRKWDKATNLK